MEPLTFDSHDTTEVEAFVSKMYSRMRIGATGERTHTRITRRLMTPEVAFDDLDYSFDFGFEAEPQRYLVLCDVESGAVRLDGEGRGQTFGAGDQFLICRPGLPYQGVVHAARLPQLTLDPAVLTQVASNVAETGGPVRILDHRPVSRLAAQQLRHTIAYVRDQAMTADGLNSPLLVSAARQLLAASLLGAFPNTAVADPAAADRRDAHPATLGRAVAFIDEHAHEDITVAAIAAAAFVTIRAIQLAFRRHLDTTPMEYLRRVRLALAHADLLAADPARETITTVSYRWGFASPSRFAASYRQAYGVLPSHTLRQA